MEKFTAHRKKQLWAESEKNWAAHHGPRPGTVKEEAGRAGAGPAAQWAREALGYGQRERAGSFWIEAEPWQWRRLANLVAGTEERGSGEVGAPMSRGEAGNGSSTLDPAGPGRIR